MRLVVVTVLLVVGIGFSLSAAVGILRLPDLYLRIQASSKSVTLGAAPVLLALVVAEGPVSTYTSRAVIVGGLLLVFAPLASHALARAAYKSGVPMWRGAVTDQVKDRADDETGTGEG